MKDTAPSIDPTEAPAGYFAILKSSCERNAGNLCRQCDWRPECQKEETDFTLPGHRCMGYAIETPDGKTIQRRDGCSVVFKRIVPVAKQLQIQF